MLRNATGCRRNGVCFMKSLSYILFDGYEESKLVTFHTGRKHEKFSSLLVLFH